MECRACSGSSESEAFRIDDLLDFSSEEIGAPIASDGSNHKGGADMETAAAAFSGDSTVTETEAAAGEVASRAPPVGAVAVLLPAELCVPTDALEELDWLSGLIDDTFEPCAPVASAAAAVEQKSPLSVRTWLRCRARSKPRRTGGACGGGGGSSSRSVVFVNSFVSPAAPRVAGGKKAKKTAEGGLQRRCSHCAVQKTPQWRTGPQGPKTLCNACGVRYKSGRLLPEYRPALSPTFSSDVHSNCHRKVVEIRRQKEAQQEGIVA